MSVFGGEADKINSSSLALRWFHMMASQGGFGLLLGVLLARPPRPTCVTVDGCDRQSTTYVVLGGNAAFSVGVAGLSVSFRIFGGGGLEECV